MTGSDLKGPALGEAATRSATRSGSMRRDASIGIGPGGRGGGGGAGVDGHDVFLAALEAAPMPMVLSDPNRPDNPIVFANPAFLRLTGYERAEVLGRNCRFLQGPASDPGAVDEVRRAIRARREVAVEMVNHRKDGTPFWNALFIAPVFGPGGELSYFFASQLDVSRRRAAEEALAAAEAAAGKGAARAGRAKAVEITGEGPGETGGTGGRPVGDVAHDLNNMLQVIAGHLEGFGAHASASGDARLLRRVRAAAEAADRATALVRELSGHRDEAGSGAAAPRVGVPAADRSGGRVLVVDDRAEVAELARTMLAAAGYAAEVASGGADALEKLRAGFDLLFSDLVMPGGLDGVALAREAQRRHPRLKVLLTTGRAAPASVSVVAPASAGGGDDGVGFEVIPKPYRRSELVAAVRRLLDRPA